MPKRKLKLPTGHIGTGDLLSRLGGSYRKSSVPGLVAAGKLPGERTAGGHWQFKDDASLAQAIQCIQQSPSAQRRSYRVASQPLPNEEPTADDLERLTMFVSTFLDQLLDMYFDGRTEQQLNAKEKAELIRRFKFFWDRIGESVQTRFSPRTQASVKSVQAK